MTEKIFKVTQDAVKRRMEKLEVDLGKTRDDLKGLDSTRDGDMMDDPLMHALLEKQEIQSRELLRLRGYLTADFEVIEAPEAGENTEVTLGHQVTLKVAYADGFEDTFTVTIGTTIDKQYLEEMPIYARLFNGSDRILISNDTPLARAIMGKSAGQSVKYETGGDIHKAKILKVESSPLFTEG